MKYTKHIAGKFENWMQHCIICGEVISDYRNSMMPVGSPPPAGFPEGDVYISHSKNPQMFSREIASDDTFEDCKPV